MYPILFEYGAVIIPAWHTFYVIGAFSAFYLLSFLSKRHFPAFTPHIPSLFLVCYIGGYFGARLLSIFVDQKATGLEIVSQLFALGPMTFYGGAIGCFLCGAAYVRKIGFRIAEVMDIALPSGLLALAIGRIGCFLNGDDFGAPIPLRDTPDPWWSVTFPNLQDGVARYPVQLISTVCVSLLVLAVVIGFRKINARFGPGGVGTTAIVGYAIFRFFVEFLRGDPRGSIGPASTSQFISVGVLVTVLACYLWARHSRQREGEGG